MTRQLLFVLVLTFSGILGLVQGAPVIAVSVLFSGAIVLAVLSRTLVTAVLYGIVGSGLAIGAMQLRLDHLRIPVGTTVEIHGVVSKEGTNESWVIVQRCSGASCPHGVVFATSLPLGTTITTRCELLPLPKPDEPWKWWKSGVSASCNPLNRIEQSSAQGIGRLYAYRRMLREKIDAAFAPRSAGLFSGILFGDTSSMPLSVATDFRRTGTTHIVALSGFNVTIILQALVTLGLPLVGKRWTTVLGLGMVVVFVIATGASSSVVRAAVMAIILQGIRLVGRPVHPDRVVAFSVVLMSLQNPWLLWHDLGFQLSMSSTFGLLRLRPALERFGTWIPTVWELRDNFISTVAASLASAPILLATFGGWSLISFPANVVVLPAIPMIMGIGTLSLPALLLPQSLQHLALAPVDALMRGVLRSLQLFSSIPWAYQQIPTWGILLSILLTIFCIAAAYAYSERSPR